MKTLKRDSLGAAVLAALVLLAAAQGCDDNDNDNPKPPPVITTGGKTGSGGASSSAGATEGGAVSEAGGPSAQGGGVAQVGGSPNEDGTSGAGGNDTGPVPTCDHSERGEEDCFKCPTNGVLVEWLNRCPPSPEQAFDNAARLPKLNADGSVPALPN
jgi:hypothetical protein